MSAKLGASAAFPRPAGPEGIGGWRDLGTEGLSKRELLTAVILHGLLCNPESLRHGLQSREFAESAVRYADELLTELAK